MMNTPVSEVGPQGRSVRTRWVKTTERSWDHATDGGTERARLVSAATARAGACFLQSRVTRRRDVDWLLAEPPAFKSVFGVLWGADRTG